MSETLEISIEDILHELMVLEELSLIVVRNGVINFTSKGEILVKTITIDESIVNKIREALIKVPKTPLIHVSNIIKEKLMDKENHLASIETYRKELTVPAFPRININNIVMLNVDKSLNIYPKLKPTIMTIPQIPQITTIGVHIKTLNKTLNEEVFTASTKEHKVAEKPVAKIAEKVKKVVKPGGARLSPSLLTMLFEDKTKYSVKGLLFVKPERPVIIVAIKQPGEEYIATLLSILREIYRMKVGGLPTGRYTGTKTAKYIAEDEAIRQGLIKVIDDSKADFLKIFEISKVEEFDNINLDKLRDRLIELSVQGLSFLVFYVNENRAKPFLTYLHPRKEKIIPGKLVIISPRRLEPELKSELARASWGFVEPKEPLINNTIDQHFKFREEEFNDILEKITTKRRYVKIVKESIEDEEGIEGFESPLHYQLKVFLVYYLIKKLKLPEEDIETETMLLADGKKIVPDIYVRSRRLAVEIETFYGTGLTPWRKLERTIEKYRESSVADEVWIVIPPLQTMLYLKDLIGEIKELREKGYSFIRFYTVNLLKRKLIPIEMLPKRLSKAFAKFSVPT